MYEKDGGKKGEIFALCSKKVYFFAIFAKNRAVFGKNSANFPQKFVYVKKNPYLCAAWEKERIKMITVVVPTYNNVTVLSKSLMTWTKQSMSVCEFEVIVVDNNSKDDTQDLVHEFEVQYGNIYYLKETTPGATNARHAGARVAKGEILVFADDDGLYNTDCLSAIADAFERLNGVEAIACKIDILWDKPAPEWLKPYAFMQGKLDYGSTLKMGYNLHCNSGLFAIKKKTFEELHGFNPDLIGGKLIGDGDTGLVIKMWDACKLIGWTPFAKMQHMQQVDKHGSEKGIALHFYNTGVGDAYAIFRKNDFRLTWQVMKYFFMSVALFSKKWIQYYILNTKDRKVFFSLQQRRGQLEFFKNLCNKELRKEICKRDLY